MTLQRDPRRCRLPSFQQLLKDTHLDQSDVLLPQRNTQQTTTALFGAPSSPLVERVRRPVISPLEGCNGAETWFGPSSLNPSRIPSTVQIAYQPRPDPSPAPGSFPATEMASGSTDLAGYDQLPSGCFSHSYIPRTPRDEGTTEYYTHSGHSVTFGPLSLNPRSQIAYQSRPDPPPAPGSFSATEMASGSTDLAGNDQLPPGSSRRFIPYAPRDKGTTEYPTLSGHPVTIYPSISAIRLCNHLGIIHNVKCYCCKKECKLQVKSSGALKRHEAEAHRKHGYSRHTCVCPKTFNTCWYS